MKIIALALSLMIGTQVLADNDRFKYEGKDNKGKACVVFTEMVPNQDGEISSVTVDAAVGGYTLAGIQLDIQSEELFVGKDTLLMDQGNDHYSRVIGAPITIGGLGLIHAGMTFAKSSETQAIAKIKLWGEGAWKLWKRDYTCTLTLK